MCAMAKNVHWVAALLTITGTFLNYFQHCNLFIWVSLFFLSFYLTLEMLTILN